MKARDAFRLTAIAAALLAALAPGQASAQAQEPLVPYGLSTAASSASAGLGYTPDDGRRFGQYNGVNESGVYGLFDFNLVRRDEETGTWQHLFGRNIGLDNRLLRWEQNRQGNWGYFLEFSQIPRYEPLHINSAVAGIGTSNLFIPSVPTGGGPVELKTRRDALALGGQKALAGNWDLQVVFRNEEKEGTRLFARGTTGAGPAFGNFEFTPEPINSTTRQLDVKLNYTTSELQLSGGYYGTFFDNHHNSLNLVGGQPSLATFTPIGLPPGNESHQLYLAGGYGFTPTTRANFKFAHARATQDDAFIPGVPLAPGIGGSLEARVDTTLMQAGITARPMPKLGLLADLRYEDRDDKTPVRVYITPASSTHDGTNEPRSIRTVAGKFEANYALPHQFRVTGGVGYEEKKRNTSAVRVVSFRETTDELAYRAELRRVMSETLTGAVSYVHSIREGSPWQTTVQTSGVVGSNLVAPIHLADRTRDKLKLALNWNPSAPLTLNFNVEVAQDDYETRDGSGIGPMEGGARNFAIDADYVFTEQWRATAWYSRNDTKAEQTVCSGATSSGVCGTPTFAATTKNLSDSLGFGVRGKPAGKVEIGADLSYSDIRDEYQQQTLVGAPVSSLPNINTTLTRLNLFGRYALQKTSGVRLDYIYDRYKTDDWTWSSWLYADGTSLSDPNQTVHFLGVSYYHRFF